MSLFRALTVIERTARISTVISCRQAYRNPTGKESHEQWHFELCGTTLIVSIAGSNDVADWKQKFKPGYRDFHGLNKARIGFVEGAENIIPHVEKMIEEQAELGWPVKKLLFTGHSAGAAKAIVCAYYFHDREFKVECSVLACPRLVFMEPDHRDFPVIEFHAWGDLVPRLPPYIPFFRPWKRIGTYRRCGGLTIRKIISEIFSFIFQSWNICSVIRIFSDAHRLSNYESD